MVYGVGGAMGVESWGLGTNLQSSEDDPGCKKILDVHRTIPVDGGRGGACGVTAGGEEEGGGGIVFPLLQWPRLFR